MIDWTPALGRLDGPRYLAIAEAIAAAIRAGELAPGARLPPQRRLAERLGIDFTTVSRGYAEAQARGLIDSHVGRGSFVRAEGVRAAPPPDPRRAREADLSMNLPPEPADPALLARMREGMAAVSADLVALLRYQSPIGSERDREAAGVWLAERGLAPGLDRVAVAPGAHVALVAILSTLARAGDVVLCEALAYPGLRAIAQRLGLGLVGLEGDADGPRPEALEAAIRRHGPRALCLNPTLHNPTTRTIPAPRRAALAEVLRRHRLPLIEDDACGFVPLLPPAPFAALAPELVWHLGGLSKCLGAGLRLAYVVAPDARAAVTLAQALRAVAVMPSPIAAALATRWIEDGTAEAIRRALRAEAAARQAIAAEVLQGFAWEADREAFSLWLQLPEGAGRAELMGRMAGRQIGLMPSDAFAVAGAPGEQVRVCLGGPLGREDLRAGLLFLADTLSGGGWMG